MSPTRTALPGGIAGTLGDLIISLGPAFPRLEEQERIASAETAAHEHGHGHHARARATDT
jgi:hypothetical protein